MCAAATTHRPGEERRDAVRPPLAAIAFFFFFCCCYCFLLLGRRVSARTRMVRMRLHVRDLGIEVQVFDDGVVGLGVLLRAAFIAGAHDPR